MSDFIQMIMLYGLLDGYVSTTSYIPNGIIYV